MVRKYRRTGRPAGRPRKAPFDPAKAEVMLEQLSKLAVAAAAASPTDTVESLHMALADSEAPPTPAANLNQMVAFMTAEELSKNADKIRGYIAGAVADFHQHIPATLARLGKYEPEKALRLYIELTEYLVPKLSRSEMVGQVQHTHEVFVVTREEPPDPAIEAEFEQVPQ